jgi:hypothetical protein
MEIVSPDADALVAHFTHVHVVVFGEPDADLGRARIAKLDGEALVGIRKPLAVHETPIVRTYLGVPNIDSAVKGAEMRDDRVRPAEGGGRGTFAILIQGGVQLGLWQP